MLHTIHMDGTLEKNIQSKQKYKIIYNEVECVFIPDMETTFDKLPDMVQGRVLYVDQGEYNPSSWFKSITVMKQNILHAPSNSACTNSHTCGMY